MGHIRKLQKALGVGSYSTIYKWINGPNKCPAEKADALEELTGIPAMKFCLPKKRGNPWPEVEQFLNSSDL